jgi:thioredoxin 1
MYKNYSELGNQPEKNRDLYAVLELVNNEQKSQIISTNYIVCVDIYANWCGPCKQTESAYSILAQRYNKQGFCMLVKENFQTNLTENINGLPTYQFFVNGKYQEQVIGADLEAVENTLNKYINASQNNMIQGPNFSKNGIRSYRNPAENQNHYTEPENQLYQSRGAMYQSYGMNKQ